MPAQTVKSGLLQKYRDRGLGEAVRKHADDPTSYGVQRLPVGIVNGVARLTKCGFHQYKPGSNMKTADGKSAVGEYYFRCEGTVIEPHDVDKDGVKITVRGLQTSTMIPVCATKDSKGEVASVENHIDAILNLMRTLGGETYTQGATDDQLEALAKGLEDAGPFFRFSTEESKPTPEYPNPRTWERWHGAKGLEDYVPPDDVGTGSGVEDSGTPAAPPPRTNGTPTTRTPAVAKPPTVKKPAPESEPEPFSEMGDLDTLAETAMGDGDDAEQAQAALKEQALTVGVSEEDVGAAADWYAVKELILAAGQTSEEPADEETSEPEPYRPKVKDSCKYRPRDPATKKPAKTARDVVILSVDPKMETVTLKDLETGKVVADPRTKKAVAIPWGLLEAE